MSPVAVQVEQRVATIRMHEPAKRNALGPAMLGALTAAFAGLAGQDVRAVILRAAPGDSVWCAGFDIAELAPGLDPLARDGALQALFQHVAECPAPVIAMLHGSAWGGGTDLALRCDMIVGDPTASLAFTPARLGLPYDPEGLLNALLRLGPGLALEMFATAAPIGADRLHRAGALAHLVAETELDGFTLDLARRIAANAPLSVASAKQQIRAFAAHLPLAPALAQALHEGRRRALDSVDYAEGLAAFRERRTPEFRGS